VTLDLSTCAVPNIWLRPNNQRREANAAKARLTIPYSDHLTLLNVYNQYRLQGESALKTQACPAEHSGTACLFFLGLILGDGKSWACTNYFSLHALQQADNVRAQLQRTMERLQIHVVTLEDEANLLVNIRQALVCGFFMQVAYKEGRNGNYLTVKDHQVKKN
jgi:pre-mRNA-splicing factor ATP-dependent RNA helicase DHX15/PRP43